MHQPLLFSPNYSQKKKKLAHDFFLTDVLEQIPIHSLALTKKNSFLHTFEATLYTAKYPLRRAMSRLSAKKSDSIEDDIDE
jgi:hypothetical protein